MPLLSDATLRGPPEHRADGPFRGDPDPVAQKGDHDDHGQHGEPENEDFGHE
ncbi:MAG: hypothetical protein HQ582_22605 [Planctomycetes bacterium]|nr:hypothetical protein [Planctomycetota bacterium]